jgi:hypothetical protein
MPPEFDGDRGAIACQDQSGTQPPGGHERAVHDGARRLVAAHRVDCDPDGGFWLRASGLAQAQALNLVDFLDLAALVIPAVRTDLMRRLGLVTLRTLAERDGLQRIVRAPLGGARFGMTSFGIRHRLRLVF